jgi:polyphosphate kinase 2 (PPK2 family)
MRAYWECATPAPEVVGNKLWKHRFESIVDFERHLMRQGLVVLKFFLHLSWEEQRRRFLARLNETDKHWKFSASDLRERAFWDDYGNGGSHDFTEAARPGSPSGTPVRLPGLWPLPWWPS